MRKLTLLSLLFFCLSLGVSAQAFGIRAGFNNTDVNFDRDDVELSTDGETNFMAGIFLDLPLGTEFISIQPEVNYVNRSFTGEFGVDLGDNLNVSRDVAYIELGALLKLSLGDDEGLGFYVGAGPTVGYAVSGTTTEFGDERDIDFDADRLNRGSLNFAGVGGITYNIGGPRFFVEARYNGSFSDQSDLDTDDVSQRSIGVNGGVAFTF